MTNPAPGWTVEDIARVCHEANAAIQWTLGEPTSPMWNNAPTWMRDPVIAGVRTALDGATPEQLHEAWCEDKRADGWRYGPVKDEAAKFHPCLVPYAELSENQRRKDAVFHGIVRALSDGDEPCQPAGKTVTAEINLTGTRPVAEFIAKVMEAEALLRRMTAADVTALPSKAAAAMTMIQGALRDLNVGQLVDEPKRPKVADTVHYVSYGTSGGEYDRACRAAIIAETHGIGADGLERASLVVLNPTGMFFDRQTPHLEAEAGPTCESLPRGGTWHWSADA